MIGKIKKTALIIVCFLLSVLLTVGLYYAVVLHIEASGDIICEGDTELDAANIAYVEDRIPELIEEMESSGIKVERYTARLEPANKEGGSNCCWRFYAVVRLTDIKAAKEYFDWELVSHFNSSGMAQAPMWDSYKEPFEHMGYSSFLQLEPGGRFIEYFDVLPNVRHIYKE